jgi:hypothetical protein
VCRSVHVFNAHMHTARVTKDDSAMNSSVSLIWRICTASAHYSVEFDFRVLGDGRSASARYANNSNYRNDSLIRKESKTIRDWSPCN